MGIIVGRDANGRRFAANTPGDPATLMGLEHGEQVGRPGTVTQNGNLNLFTPD
jgi:acetyl-CoA C-acetyltransferase